MARNHGKKALYEVIGKSRSKFGSAGGLESLHPNSSVENDVDKLSSSGQVADNVTKWPRRPRILQFNADRIEFSIPYSVAIALVLGVVLLALVFFRLGQITYQKRTVVDSQAPRVLQRQPVQVQKTVEQIGNFAVSNKAVSANSKADHCIVITQYTAQRDLEPVQRYFAANGIETIIEKRGSGFFLLSKNVYENPQKNGTDGYTERMKIIEAGADYKAPQGYESFAPKLFKDAYGEKVK